MQGGWQTTQFQQRSSDVHENKCQLCIKYLPRMACIVYRNRHWGYLGCHEVLDLTIFATRISRLPYTSERCREAQTMAFIIRYHKHPLPLPTTQHYQFNIQCVTKVFVQDIHKKISPQKWYLSNLKIKTSVVLFYRAGRYASLQLYFFGPKANGLQFSTNFDAVWSVLLTGPNYRGITRAFFRFLPHFFRNCKMVAIWCQKNVISKCIPPLTNFQTKEVKI